MKTLEDQLAAYGKQRSESQAPFTSEELSGRSARNDPIVPPASPPEVEDSPRLVAFGVRSVPRKPPLWVAGVAAAVITLVGFGLIGMYVGGVGPAVSEGTLTGSSNSAEGTAPESPNTAEPVRRSLNVDGILFTLDLPPSGWELDGDFAISKDVSGGVAGAEAVVYFATFPGGSNVVPCPDLPFGRLPDTTDIESLARSMQSTVGDPYIVGGLQASFIEVEVKDEVGCDPGYLYSWPTQTGGPSWSGSKPGDFLDAWFIDIDGEILVVVAETRGLIVRRELGSEIFQIVDSIRFPSIVPTASADYIIDLNTGEKTLLPAAIRSLAPSQYVVSPDGTTLAFVAPDFDGSFQLFTAGIDGTDIRQITHPPTEADSPAWSPDGSLVAYVASEDLFVLDVATGDSTQILTIDLGVHSHSGTQFTPDGSSILYTGADYQLWTVPIGGGISKALIGTMQGVAAGEGSLSPDGSIVTFLGNRIGGPGALRFVAATDGSELRQLGNLSSGDCGWVNPAGTWSTDGTQIVCTGNNEVRVVDVATGETSFAVKGRSAQWLDDHTLLVEAWGR